MLAIGTVGPAPYYNVIYSIYFSQHTEHVLSVQKDFSVKSGDLAEATSESFGFTVGDTTQLIILVCKEDPSKKIHRDPKPPELNLWKATEEKEGGLGCRKREGTDALTGSQSSQNRSEGMDGTTS